MVAKLQFIVHCITAPLRVERSLNLFYSSSRSIYIYIYNKLKWFEPTEMLLRQQDPREFTVQTSRGEFKTSMKNEGGQLRAKEKIYIR